MRFLTLIFIFVVAATRFASAQGITVNQLTADERDQYTRLSSEPAVAECYLKIRPFARKAWAIVQTRDAELAAGFEEVPSGLCGDQATHDKAMADDRKIVSYARMLALQAIGLKLANFPLKGRTLRPID
jgi:hypothetical protein